MTPLAHRVARQLLVPIKERDPFWQLNSGHISGLLDDTHFFEATAILPLLGELATSFKKMGLEAADELFGKLAFLPAPKTWIEINAPAHERVAFLLDSETGGWCRVTLIFETDDNLTYAQNFGALSTHDGTYQIGTGKTLLPARCKDAYEAMTGDPHSIFSGLLSMAHGCLVCINSPKIVGRSTRAIHKGIERDLRSSGNHFPLHGWTEIKLRVNKPPEINDGQPHEAVLTGRRALHFVRKHVRIRLGQLEYVSAHWRGDAAIGIKQSRYKVMPN